MENVVKFHGEQKYKHKNKIQKCTQDKIFNVVNTILLILIVALFIYPLIFILSASISKPADVISGKMVLFPTSIYLDGYKEIIKDTSIWTGFLNSIIVVIFGSALNLAITFTVGYALSRKDFFGRRFFSIFFIFTMFFSGGLIPTYMLISSGLHMQNSLLALIIPSAVSVWNIILAKTYFQNSLSDELLEAAKIDGCGNIRFFFSIALPLAKPIIAVILLYNIVGRWNSYFDAMIFIDSANKYPLQLVIRNLLLKGEIIKLDPNAGDMQMQSLLKAESMKYGVIILSTIPMLVIYPFVQKYFIKGVMVGSLKG